jgi:hypothetical protein
MSNVNINVLTYAHSHTHTHVCIYYKCMIAQACQNTWQLRDYENQRKYRITRILGQGPSYELEIYEMMRHFLKKSRPPV